MHPYVNTAVKAARRAGSIITKGFDRLDIIKVTKKGPKDFVTNIDKEAEQEIINTLITAYPSHSILSEERGSIKGDDYQWIIDPLDGTTNFMHGFPHFAISIALKHQNRIEHAVIYDPLRDDLFTASRGEGAQKNNRRIRVSNRSNFGTCLFGVGFPYRSPEQHDVYFKALSFVSKQCIGLRRAGSAALDLAYVASGQLDGFFELGLQPWDIAAGILLVKEAGGLVSDMEGGEDFFKTGGVITANPKIFKQLLTVVKPFLSLATKEKH